MSNSGQEPQTAEEWRDGRIAELEKALRNLVDKLDAIDKVVTGVFVMAAIHGCEYSGPNYGEELKVARKVLDHE